MWDNSFGVEALNVVAYQHRMPQRLKSSATVRVTFAVRMFFQKSLPALSGTHKCTDARSPGLQTRQFFADVHALADASG
jgi:hypothetical protein